MGAVVQEGSGFISWEPRLNVAATLYEKPVYAIGTPVLSPDKVQLKRHQSEPSSNEVDNKSSMKNEKIKSGKISSSTQRLLRGLESFNYGLRWLVLSAFLLFELNFNSMVGYNLFLHLLTRSVIWYLEVFGLLITAPNAIYYFLDSFQRNGTDVHVLKEYMQQYFIVSNKVPTMDTSLNGSVTFPSDGRADLSNVFSFLGNFFYSRAASRHAISFQSSFDRSWASAHGSFDQSYSPVSRLDESLNSSGQLSSQMGFRSSPRNRATTTIHTREQLDSILHENVAPKTERSFLSRTMSDMDTHTYEVGTTDNPLFKDDSSLFEDIKAFSTSRNTSKIQDSVGELSLDGIFPRMRQLSARHSISGSPDLNTFDGVNRKESAKQIKYYLDTISLPKYELKLRVWICNTILRPIVLKIDELNSQFARYTPPLQLKIGETTLENIQTMLSSRPELCSTTLPLLLPYLRAHSNQYYLVQRIRDLASDITIKEYKWNSGSNEHIRDSSNGFTRIVQWHDGLPTDAELIWHLFRCYLDSILSPSPFIVNHMKRPFTNVYYHRKSSRLNPVQSGLNSFFIAQVSDKPPLFDFVANGRVVSNLASKEGSNLFHAILYFIAHCHYSNNSRIGHMNLGDSALNLVEVID